MYSITSIVGRHFKTFVVFSISAKEVLRSPLFEGISEDMTEEEKVLSLSTPGYHMAAE